MNRKYITDALEAIIEDATGFNVRLPLSSEIEAFFEPDELAAFRDIVAEEFNLPNYSIIDTAETFRELVALLEDELF